MDGGGGGGLGVWGILTPQSETIGTFFFFLFLMILMFLQQNFVEGFCYSVTIAINKNGKKKAAPKKKEINGATDVTDTLVFLIELQH